MKKIKFILTALIVSSVAFTSCSSDDDSSNKNQENGQYKNGIFVLAEGAMGSNNANVTFYKNGITTQNIFKTANNNQPLGNIAQSILFDNNTAYIVINGSNKIEVVDATNFVSKTTITSNLLNPRYATTANGFLYVSNWGDLSNNADDYISVYRLADLAFVKKIDVKEGPENLLIENNKLVIAHAGGLSNGNSVSIYNTQTNSLENIVVGDVPSALVEENNHVFVLCTGITWGDVPSAGKLVKLDLNTNKVTQTINFKEGENPRFLVEDNNQLFYTLNNKIFKVELNSTSLPTTEIFTSDAKYIYGFNILNNSIYIADAKDFNSNGEVKYYSQTGSLLGKFETGIGPNSIVEHD